MNDIVNISTPGEVATVMPVFDTGLSDVIQVKPSRLTLVQHTTENPRGAKPGQILDEDSGAIYDSVTGTIIKSRKSRVFFPPGSKITKGAEPLCRSNNAIYPAENVKQRQSTHCNTCPKGAWGDGPPPCKLKLEFIFGNVADGLPYYLSVGGIGVAPVSKALGKINLNVGKKYKTPLHFAVVFKPIKDGTVYRWDIPEVITLSDEQAQPFIDIYQMIAAQKEQAQIASTQQESEEAVDNIIEGEIITTQEV